MRTTSALYKRTINATSASEAPLLLLEITHSGLAQPIRVVNDNQDLSSNGNTFTALAFRCTLPEDVAGQVPRAVLSVDNVGKEMVTWLEASSGAQGAQCRIMQVLRSAPNVIEWEMTIDLHNLSITPLEVAGELGFDDLLTRPAVRLQYRPDNTPGIF